LRVEAGSAPLTAFQPGRYVATTAGGRRLTATVAALPEAQVVTGPWPITFPAGGKTTTVTLARLASWTESADPVVKYFSGTATYTRTLSIPADRVGPGKVLLLDLGLVREIAQVSLNGRDLGTLWRAPFRVDLTAAAKSGDNQLTVRVTNLWANRLIGDEQLPADLQWTGRGPLAAWPAWLLTGQPRPGPRQTFTVWKHWSGDDPLQESGLLGPVVLRSGRVVKLGG